MLIPPKVIMNFISDGHQTVLHVGGHLAEELDSYLVMGFQRRFWVEANPDQAALLESRLSGGNDRVLTFAAWDTDGEILELKVANNTQASSVLNMKEHLNEHPEVEVVSTVKVLSKRLDSLNFGSFRPTFLNLDIQGAEFQALKGAEGLMEDLTMIYCEVNFKELYEGCYLVEDIDGLLSKFGFRRILTRRLIHGWGDAIFVRKDSLTFENIFLAKRKNVSWEFQRFLLTPAYKLLQLLRKKTWA